MHNVKFAELPTEHTILETARTVLLPVEYDQTSTWIKGADKGPRALIVASESIELYDIETDSEPGYDGIHIDSPITGIIDPAEMVQAVYARTLKHLNNNKLTVTIGGEHSVSIGAMQAYCEHFENVTILQLDAHADLRDEYHGSKYNHACVMARARELAPIVQAGIRSMDVSEKKYIDHDSVFFAENIHDNNYWFDKLINQLTENVYLTIDLDVFDPSILPSTGTPEPGGLGWYQILALLKKLCTERNVVGFDIVELCPNDINKHSDILAAKLLYKMLAYIKAAN